MKRISCLILTGCLLALCGCISYSENQLAAVKQWPMTGAGAQKPTAYLKVESQYLLNDEAQANGFNQAALEKLLVQSYQDSGLFSRVSTVQQTADRYITVHVSNHERANMAAAVITGLTLYIIPSTFRNELGMQTDIRDGGGALLGSVEKHETITTWMQLLLIFALPFSESTDNVLNQLSQSSLEAAAQQQLL